MFFKETCQRHVRTEGGFEELSATRPCRRRFWRAISRVYVGIFVVLCKIVLVGTCQRHVRVKCLELLGYVVFVSRCEKMYDKQVFKETCQRHARTEEDFGETSATRPYRRGFWRSIDRIYVGIFVVLYQIVLVGTCR